jgi:linoleoyl-CoA desaturase
MPPFASDAERIAAFGRAIDALKSEAEASVSERDVLYIVRLRRFSRALEVLGRGLLHVSWEPISFGLAVLILAVHKQIEALEIGHTALHGTFDRLPGAEHFRSGTFRWLMPIDEASWMNQHNLRHHQYTNISGRDPDLRYGIVRLNRRVPYRAYHALQPLTVVSNWLGFATIMNVHATGLVDVYIDWQGLPQVLRDRKFGTLLRAHYALLRKYFYYYAKEALVFPALAALAGVGFWKVLLGNFLSDVLRNIYTALSIHCGHINTDAYAPEERAHSRAQWYVMQVEATHDFEVPVWVSILCGSADRQIEHHLFPRLPTTRLREIAPRVRELCAAHGVRYRTDPWPRTLRRAVQTLWWLSWRTPTRAELRSRERDAAAGVALATSTGEGT